LRLTARFIHQSFINYTVVITMVVDCLLTLSATWCDSNINK